MFRCMQVSEFYCILLFNEMTTEDVEKNLHCVFVEKHYQLLPSKRMDGIELHEVMGEKNDINAQLKCFSSLLLWENFAYHMQP